MPLDIQKIKRLREHLGLTQEEAARRAGMNGRSKWGDIENGRRPNIELATLEKIADALGCKAKDLMK